MAITYDPFKEAVELREQLASPRRRLGFFFGAGTSMAVGLDGIGALTINVEAKLPPQLQQLYATLRRSLGEKSSVEDILNRIRIYRELLGDTKDREVDGLTGASARDLDRAICGCIAQLVNINPPGGAMPQRTMAQWCRLTQRDYPIEIFTTNYDLLFERAMEELGIPFFDGFVGSVSPFFAPESVEADGSAAYADVYPPRSWLRLWKVHGSIGWRLSGDGVTSSRRITRVYHPLLEEEEELLIYPSREKYNDSRKQPFITYLDRLRRFLNSGEVMLLISGYSFGDQHLNELLLQGLRANSRLNVVVLSFGSLDSALINAGLDHRNLTIFAADKACVGGIVGQWETRNLGTVPVDWPLWDTKRNAFALGDFGCFSRYLEVVMGFSSTKTVASGSAAKPTEEVKANEA